MGEAPSFFYFSTMSQNSLRFGIHDFLNAQPLIKQVLPRGEKEGFSIVVDVPSALADRLKDGQLDLAMIPAVEYLREAANYRLVPGVCIASRGDVGTVLLLSKVAPEKIRSIALDHRSRTSVALLKILFPLDKSVQFESAAPKPGEMLSRHDAALIIGDRALEYRPGSHIHVFDLSREWFDRTGKTFVHAVVAVRQEVILKKNQLNFILNVRREAVDHIDAVVEDYVKETGRDAGICEDYLKNKIIYNLGEQEMEGLNLFHSFCIEHGIILSKNEILLL